MVKKKLTINTAAYHDHNYGAWPTNLFNWIWSQFHRIDKQFSLVLGSYHVPLTKSDYIGYAFIRYRSLRIEIGTLCDDEFHLQPLEWKIIGNKKYSVHTRVQALNKNYKIDVDYRARVSNESPVGHILNLKFVEQISQYQVSLYEKQEADWRALEQNITGHMALVNGAILNFNRKETFQNNILIFLTKACQRNPCGIKI
jgi:hypothetical protein